MAFSLTRQSFRPLIPILAVVLCVFQITTSLGLVLLDPMVIRAGHVAFVFSLIFLLKASRKEWRQDPASEPLWALLLDLLLLVCCVGACMYLIVNQAAIQDRMPQIDPITQNEFLLGVLLIATILEATRRTAGMSLVIVALVALAYAVWGNMLPSRIGHLYLEPDRIIESLYLLNDGIWGTSIGASATIIYVFILFGSLLEKTNMSGVFLELACLLTRNAKGGPAKASIFGSALFGSVSGSAAANVYATGTFTIPLMKRVGYKPEFAGAVEAVASSGGLIMPPVMGSIAFVMAEYTGIPYITICKNALLPAILYYLGLFTMIHFEAHRCNVGGTPADLVPRAGEITRKSYRFLPIVLLIFLMMSGRSVIFSALAACLFIVILSMFSKETRLTPKRFLDVMEDAAVNLLMIAACCACVGIVIGVVTMTGFGFSFVSMMSKLASINITLFLLVLMGTCIIFGMGLPALPAYILVATFGAPALTQAGIPLVGAHMFVMYYAIVSGITPPVCLVAYAGAAIAEANPMKTGITAFKLGIAAYLVPFFFIFEPALLLIGDWQSIVLATCTAIVGIICVASAMQGWLLLSSTLLERALALSAGLTLIYPGLITDLLGSVCLALTLVLQLARRKKLPPADPNACASSMAF